MSTQLEDTKRLGCAKPNDCASLLKSENLRMRIDENDKKNDALKLKSLSKADIPLLRSKFAAGAGELSLEYERTHGRSGRPRLITSLLRLTPAAQSAASFAIEDAKSTNWTNRQDRLR